MSYIISEQPPLTTAGRRIILNEDGEAVTVEAGRYTGNQYSQKYSPTDEEKSKLLELKRYFAGRQIISAPNGPDWEHVRFEIYP